MKLNHSIHLKGTRSVFDSGGIGSSGDVAMGTEEFEGDERYTRARWERSRNSVLTGATLTGDTDVLPPLV